MVFSLKHFFQLKWNKYFPFLADRNFNNYIKLNNLKFFFLNIKWMSTISFNLEFSLFCIKSSVKKFKKICSYIKIRFPLNHMFVYIYWEIIFVIKAWGSNFCVEYQAKTSMHMLSRCRGSVHFVSFGVWEQFCTLEIWNEISVYLTIHKFFALYDFIFSVGLGWFEIILIHF